MNVRAFRDEILARLGQQSTWQGIAFILGLMGSHYATDLNWGEAAAFGGTLSALLKTLLSDPE